jgi:hypothetical protein
VLAMLWKDSPSINKWSLVVSAEWADNLPEQYVFNYFVQKLQTSLTREELLILSRINSLKTTDASIRTLTENINFTGTGMRITNTRIGSMYIEDAF